MPAWPDNALAAAVEAVEAVRGLVSDPSLLGEPPLEIVIALHIGTAIYGNIGAADRLDFTVSTHRSACTAFDSTVFAALT